jgi:type IV pilus assembly protein PilW
MLIALAIGSLLLASTYNFYMGQKKAYAIREQVSEMQQNARSGMELMVREIRMAGYNPTRTAGVGIIEAESHALRITMDLNGDGDMTDENEDITYSLYDSGGDGDVDLGRKPASGTNQPAAENIASLDFVYTLANGSTTTTPANLSQIRMIQVSLTARTARPDPTYPTNGGRRTYTLESVIIPRNLAY